MRIELYGTERLRAKLAAAADAGPRILGAALYQEAEAVMTTSKEQYVPVDTGALRASGFVELPIYAGEGASVNFGFGGPGAPYAVVVHEDLTKRHPVGQAKYLEIPLRARIAGMRNVLAMRMRDGIRQAFQRLGRVERNVLAGRSANVGQPLFQSP